MIRSDKYEDINSVKDLQEINKQIVGLGEEFNKPVKYKSEIFGELELDKELNWLSGECDWLGMDAEVHINVDESLEDVSDGIKNLEQFYKAREKWDFELRSYAAKELTEDANNWLEEGDEGVSEDDFAQRISIVSIDVNPDGTFSVTYDDDDIFAGHLVVVDGDMENGPDSAYIEG